MRKRFIILYFVQMIFLILTIMGYYYVQQIYLKVSAADYKQHYALFIFSRSTPLLFGALLGINVLSIFSSDSGKLGFDKQRGLILGGIGTAGCLVCIFMLRNIIYMKFAISAWPLFLILTGFAVTSSIVRIKKIEDTEKYDDAKKDTRKAEETDESILK